MLAVRTVSRGETDAWPIADSGLPARVCHAMDKAGVRTVGELRSWKDADILRVQSLGRISLGQIRSFFELLDRIEKGQQGFENIREVFDLFLDADELAVLSARYGFERESLRVSRKWATLEAIGQQRQCTRERVRQIEATAKRKLQSRLAQLCVEPFCDYFRSVLLSLGGSATYPELAPRVSRDVTAGFSPGGIILLLCDVAPHRLTFYRGYFSVLPVQELETLEKKALAVLESRTGRVSLDSVLSSIGGAEPAGGGFDTRQALAVILQNHPQVAATVDGHFFLFHRGMGDFLAEVMRDLALPAHFRTIMKAANERLLSGSRRGAGFVLETLSTHPGCVRAARGLYTLRTRA